MKVLSFALLVLATACRTLGEGTTSATKDADATPSCRVLVAMSDTGTLIAPATNPLSQATKAFSFGYLLDEMAVPAQALLDHGCALTYATPSGAKPVRDPQGDSAVYFTDGLPTGNGSFASAALAKLRVDALIPGAEAKAELQAALRLVDDPASPINGKGPGSFDQPLTFASVRGDLTRFDAVFVPGGYAPMLNLWNDGELGAILRWFHEQNRLTVTLCRGGVALASAAESGKPWIYQGYGMTTYSTIEDDVASLVGHVLPLWQLPFHPNHKLRDLGAKLRFSDFHSHVVEDRELLTGQNQWSAHALARRFVERLSVP